MSPRQEPARSDSAAGNEYAELLTVEDAENVLNSNKKMPSWGRASLLYLGKLFFADEECEDLLRWDGGGGYFCPIESFAFCLPVSDLDIFMQFGNTFDMDVRAHIRRAAIFGSVRSCFHSFLTLLSQ